MVTLLKPESLKNPANANVQGMVDAIENMCAQYLLQWKVLPRYCYVNSTFWADAMFDLLPTTDLYKLQVVPCNIPYDRVSLHHEHQSKRQIELYHQMTEEDGVESGKLEIV